MYYQEIMFYLLTVYKFIIRPCLDYGDIIYDQHNSKSFCEKIESYLYHTRTITGSSQIKLTQELGLELLKFRWNFRICCTIRLLGIMTITLDFYAN